MALVIECWLIAIYLYVFNNTEQSSRWRYSLVGAKSIVLSSLYIMWLLLRRFPNNDMVAPRIIFYTIITVVVSLTPLCIHSRQVIYMYDRLRIKKRTIFLRCFQCWPISVEVSRDSVSNDETWHIRFEIVLFIFILSLPYTNNIECGALLSIFLSWRVRRTMSSFNHHHHHHLHHKW